MHLSKKSHTFAPALGEKHFNYQKNLTLNEVLIMQKIALINCANFYKIKFV